MDHVSLELHVMRHLLEVSLVEIVQQITLVMEQGLDAEELAVKITLVIVVYHVVIPMQVLSVDHAPQDTEVMENDVKKKPSNAQVVHVTEESDAQILLLAFSVETVQRDSVVMEFHAKI